MTYVAYSKFFQKECEIAGFSDDGRMIYEDAFVDLAEVLKRNIADKRQNIVTVVGETGSGKSLKTLRLIRDMDPRWSIEKNMIYTTADFKTKIKERKHCSPISMFDEGSIMLNSSNHMKRDNVELTMIFDTMRSLGWSTFINIPKLSFLNNRIRDFHANYLIMCPTQSPVRGYDPRGFAVIYKHINRDWGKSYYRQVAVTKVPLPPPKTVKKYEEIKLQKQLEYLENYTKELDSVEA